MKAPNITALIMLTSITITTAQPVPVMEMQNARAQHRRFETRDVHTSGTAEDVSSQSESTKRATSDTEVLSEESLLEAREISTARRNTAVKDAAIVVVTARASDKASAALTHHLAQREQREVHEAADTSGGPKLERRQLYQLTKRLSDDDKIALGTIVGVHAAAGVGFGGIYAHQSWKLRQKLKKEEKAKLGNPSTTSSLSQAPSRTSSFGSTPGTSPAIPAKSGPSTLFKAAGGKFRALKFWRRNDDELKRHAIGNGVLLATPFALAGGIYGGYKINKWRNGRKAKLEANAKPARIVPASASNLPTRETTVGGGGRGRGIASFFGKFGKFGRFAKRSSVTLPAYLDSREPKLDSPSAAEYIVAPVVVVGARGDEPDHLEARSSSEEARRRRNKSMAIAALQARNTITDSNASPWLVAAGGAGWAAGAGGLWYLSKKGVPKLPFRPGSSLKTQGSSPKNSLGLFSKIAGKGSALRRLKFWKRHDPHTGVSETIERRQSKPKRNDRDLTKKQYAALWGTMGGVTGGLLLHAGWTGYKKYRKQAAELKANRPLEPYPQLAKEVPLVTQPAAKIGDGGLFSKFTGVLRKVPHLRRREMELVEIDTLQGEEPSFLGARDGTAKKAVGGTAGVLGAGAIGFGAGAGLYYAHLHHKEMRSLKKQGLMPAQAVGKPMSVDGSLNNSKNAFKSALSKFGRFKIFKRDQGTATTATLGALTAGSLGLAGAAGYHAYKQDRKMKMLQNGLYSTTRKPYATAQLGGGGLTKFKSVFSAGLSKLGRFPKFFKRHEMLSSSPARRELQIPRKLTRRDSPTTFHSPTGVVDYEAQKKRIEDQQRASQKREKYLFMTAAGIVAAASAWGGGRLLWHWGKSAMAARRAYRQRQQQLSLERNAVLGIPVPEVHRVLHAEIGGSRTPSPVLSGSSSPRTHLPNDSHHSSSAAETPTVAGAGSPSARIPASTASTPGEVELSRILSSGSGPHAHTPADTASSSGASTLLTTVQHQPATPSLPANAPPGTAWGHVTQHADGVPYLSPSP